MKKYIVLSVNDNPDYLFHVPLVCWAWEQFGWWPVVMYAGEITPLADYVFRFSFEEYDGTFVYRIDNVNGYKSETIAQMSRLYASNFYWMDQESYLLTGDIDMLPLSDYWKPNPDKLTVYGRDLTDYHYPICYIGAKAWVWTSIMDSGAAHPNHFIKRDLRRQDNMWTLDQDLITERINNSSYTPHRIDRGTDKRTGYPIGRIDRSHWTLEHKQYIDCHMYHGIQNDENKFKVTLTMLHYIWPKEDWTWWITYYKEFKKLCQKTSPSVH